ncbi:MAG TPA: hypothetical protein VFH73_22220, partial [Polyangia bacterium]|nr:hypothetical protein [Polyangia bacterium]
LIVVVIGYGGCAKISSPAASDSGGVPLPPQSPDAVADRSVSLSDAAPPTPRDAGPPPCVNLQCQRVNCAGAPTSISGTVFAPNGKLPLYNVTVYVPNAPLEPFAAGISCDRCGVVSSGKPIASAVTDSQGKFKISNVPAGVNIPLVFQVGKWRRKVMIPNVTACQDNAVTDANLTRLPRNRQEGDIPRIAVTTGSCDQLGCLLPKLGIDTAELGVAGEDKAVAYYRGGLPVMVMPGSVNNYGPPNMPHATELWNDEAKLSQHDLTLLSCECSEALTIKSAAAFSAMTNYLAKGGRIFGSHYSYVWLKNASDTDLTTAVSISTPGLGVPSGVASIAPMTIDTSFPKGKALADWMKFVDPAVMYGQIASRQIFNNVSSVTAPAALAWASSPTIWFGGFDAGAGSGGDGGAGADGGAANLRPRIITVNTPAGVPADKQCGRAAHLDAHITFDDTTMAPGVPAGAKFPESCGVNLTKGEEALAFLFFDLASCIQDDTMPVVPPIVVP